LRIPAHTYEEEEEEEKEKGEIEQRCAGKASDGFSRSGSRTGSRSNCDSGGGNCRLHYRSK